MRPSGRGCNLDIDADKGFLEEDIWELRSESIVIRKKMEGKGRVEGNKHSK